MADIPMLMKLAGRTLDVGGSKLHVGVPTIHPLRASATLVTRLCTIAGFMDEPAAFQEAAARQLAVLVPGVAADAISVGPRRVMRVKGKTVVGFGLKVKGLAPAASLQVQHVGIGGRRKMGAGVFTPVTGE